MIASRTILLTCLAAFAVSGCYSAASTEAAARSENTISLVIVTPSKKLTFDVEVARTPDEQARGLMFRTALPPFGGMLFPLSPPREASFWMKNTVIPLDMIFIRQDGTIARIAAQTIPYSLESESSGEPVAAVLELAGGRAAALGISEDDKVSWADAQN